MQGRLLVTGSRGFVGGVVVDQAGSEWQVTAVSRSEVDQQRGNVRHIPLDLLDAQRLEALFRDARPTAVIHTAAMADIDYCQAHQDEAEAINVGVTRQLAELCGACDAKLVLCSTDTVFDGERGNYREEDIPHPVNFYAETKVRAEQIVAGLDKLGIVARLALVMGLPVAERGNSFLAKMVRQLEQGGQVSFPESEIRTPVDVLTVARGLLELAAADYAGTIHLAGSTRISRYEMGLEIARHLGYAPDRIQAAPSKTLAGRAPRPRDVSLDNSKAKRILRTPMRSLTEGLHLLFGQPKAQ